MPQSGSWSQQHTKTIDLRKLMLGLALVISLLPWGTTASSSISAGSHITSQMTQGNDVWTSEGNLVAFLREGNVWLMGLDGSNQRQVTSFETDVVSIKWSPSGRYLLITHGSHPYSHIFAGSAGGFSDALVTILDVATGSLVDVHQGGQVTWAVDADDLLVETRGEGGPDGTTMVLSRLDLNGTLADLGTYTFRDQCGGPDGPGGVMRELELLQNRSPLIRYSYTFAHWYTQPGIVFINPDCGEAQILDLASGLAQEIPETSWLTGNPGYLLVQDSVMTTANAAGAYSVEHATTMAIEPGRTYALANDDRVFFTRSELVGPSTFKPPFEEDWLINNDQRFDVLATDVEGAPPQLLTTLDVYETSIPSVTADGAWLFLGTVDNPSVIERAGTIAANHSDPWAYADHLRVLRIDTTTGEPVELATNAYRPLAQPAGEVARPTSPDPDVTEPTVAPPIDAGSEGGNRLAYIGDDGNVWLMNGDGSGAVQVTTDAWSDQPYDTPVWSNGGTMLAFTRYVDGEGISTYLYRDGWVSQVPGVAGCKAVAFMPGDTQFALGCGEWALSEDVWSDPSTSFVSTANLDGGNWQIQVPMNPMLEGRWPELGRTTPSAISFGSDGTMVVGWSSPNGTSLSTVAPNALSATMMHSPLESGSMEGGYLAGTNNLLVLLCKGCYKHTQEAPQMSVAIISLDGTIQATLLTLDPQAQIGVPSLTADGVHLLYTLRDGGYPFYGTIHSLNLETGQETLIGRGMSPVWQPGSSGVVVPDESPGEVNISPEAPLPLATPEDPGGEQSPLIQPVGGSDVPVADPAVQTVNMQIHAAMCETDPQWREVMATGLALPNDCVLAGGVAITITGRDGTPYGQCLSTGDEWNPCWMELPIGIDLLINQDPATIPAGYHPLENPYLQRLFPDNEDGHVIRLPNIWQAGR